MGQYGSKVEKSDFDGSIEEKMYRMPHTYHLGPKDHKNGSKVGKSDFNASIKEKMFCMPTHRLKWQPENHRGAFRPLDSKYGYSSGLERSKNEPKMAKNSPNYGTILKNEKK